MAAALDQVKRHFGRDAVILNTRAFTRGAVLGLGGKPYVEITAAREMNDLPQALRSSTVRNKSVRGERAEGAATPVSSSALEQGTIPSQSRSDALATEVGALKTMVAELVRETRRAHTPQLPGKLYETYQQLVGNAVAEELAGRLVDEVSAHLTDDQIEDPVSVRAHLAGLLEPMIPTAGPINVPPTGEPYIVALVGPTGVGKTTTIAKLAANLSLRDRRKVGLITIDTYRIAAVEQLKTYAEILDVPLEVAMSPEQLRDARTRMSDRDVILVDTAGRSQRDTSKIGQLRAFFNVVKPDEIHLVLSSTCTERVVSETITRFGKVGFDRIIFTKLDEALGFGVILNCLQKADTRLSYVTTGQDVPSDIAVGESRALTELILGRRNPPVPAGSVEP